MTTEIELARTNPSIDDWGQVRAALVERDARLVLEGGRAIASLAESETFAAVLTQVADVLTRIGSSTRRLFWRDSKGGLPLAADVLGLELLELIDRQSHALANKLKWGNFHPCASVFWEHLSRRDIAPIWQEGPFVEPKRAQGAVDGLNGLVAEMRHEMGLTPFKTSLRAHAHRTKKAFKELKDYLLFVADTQPGVSCHPLELSYSQHYPCDPEYRNKAFRLAHRHIEQTVNLAFRNYGRAIAGHAWSISESSTCGLQVHLLILLSKVTVFERIPLLHDVAQIWMEVTDFGGVCIDFLSEGTGCFTYRAPESLPAPEHHIEEMILRQAFFMTAPNLLVSVNQPRGYKLLSMGRLRQPQQPQAPG